MEEQSFVNGEMRISEPAEEHPGEKLVDKYIYIVLAVFAGDFGIHKFYSGHIAAGILYLLFCWTFIPAFISIFDIIKACGRIKDPQNRIWM